MLADRRIRIREAQNIRIQIPKHYQELLLKKSPKLYETKTIDLNKITDIKSSDLPCIAITNSANVLFLIGKEPYKTTFRSFITSEQSSSENLLPDNNAHKSF